MAPERIQKTMNFNSTTVENIEDLMDKSESDEIKRISEVFLSAMNDWPDDLQTLEEFIKAISIDYSGLMREDVERFLKKLDLSSGAWKLEASAVLLDLWNGRDPKQSIQDIAAEIFEARKCLLAVDN
jgi:hypothetical protein